MTIAIETTLISTINNTLAMTNKLSKKSEAQHYAGFIPLVIRNHFKGEYAYQMMTTIDTLNREIVKQDTSFVITDNFVIGEPVKSIVDIKPTAKEIAAFKKSRKIISIAS